MINLIKRYTFRVNHEIYEKLKFGIFCLNKCKNVTSAQILESIKYQLSLVKGNQTHKLKIGHGGTLDSSATGVLVVGTGNGCKRLTTFLHGPKRYIVTGKFGASTDTFNDLGRITHQGKYSHITMSSLISCIEKFKGRILQVPPPYCALKRGGDRISDLVSAGKEVELTPRMVECYSIELLKFDPPYFTMAIDCGGGFYVRSLIHDVGIALESFAHVKDLCRSQQGPLTLQDCLSCDNISFENMLSAIERLHLKYGILNEHLVKN